MQDNKRVLYSNQVKRRYLKESYEEYAIKNVWKLVKSDANLRSYLPADEMDAGKFPNRSFVWGILCSVVPSWSD